MIADTENEVTVSIRDAAQCYLTVAEEEARIRWEHNLRQGLLLNDHRPAPGISFATCHGDTQLMVKRSGNSYDYLLLKGDLRRETPFTPISRSAVIELLVMSIRGESW